MPQRKQSLTDDSMEYIDDSDLEEHNSIVDNEGTASLEEANQKSLQQSYHELSFKLIADDSSKIQPRLVEVGQRVGSNWVVKDGLKPGEMVAIVGSMMLKPTMQVRSKQLSWNADSTDIK